VNNSKNFPHVLLYWGSKGGGLRLLSETINEIIDAGYSVVSVSLKNETYACLKEQLSLFQGDEKHLMNVYSPNVIERLALFARLPFSSHFLRKSFGNTKSIVIVMSSPGDLKINSLSRFGMLITRVIHDTKKHPGDLWPTNRTIREMLKTKRVILLSEHSFNAVNHRNKYRSSLARKNLATTLNLQVSGIESGYFLVAGRFKKYKNLDTLEKIAKLAPDKKFVFAGLGSSFFEAIPNIKCIDRWLTESELEFLIKEAAALIAVYQEASQSGIVEQALYWRTPCIVSNQGALVEQAKQQKLKELVVNESDASSIVEILELDFTELKSRIPKYVVGETLYETMSKLDF